MKETKRVGLVFAVMALAGFASAQQGTSMPEDLVGTWTVEDIDTTGVTDRALLTVTFDTEGRVFGLSGCNRYSGAYTRVGDTLTLGPLASTRMACDPALMHQEDRMLKSLQRATALSWSADGAALLSGPAPHVLRLRAEAAPPQDGSGYGPGHLPVTPVPDSYRCGDEVFRIAFEEGVAFVTFADGTLVQLPRDRVSGGQDQEAPRIFSNGRLTFSQDIEGQAPAVHFGRGRMAMTVCERMLP